MKKDKLGPAALFVFVLVAVLASFVSSAQTSAVTEEARTLQMIAPYRAWGKANAQPIAVSVDKIASFG
jgi:hypothetical protein